MYTVNFFICKMEVYMEINTGEIGARIRQRRKALALTQTDIKKMTGISSGNMSDIEQGKRLPAAITLIQLSSALQCSVDYILTGNSPVSENQRALSLSQSNNMLASLIEYFSVMSCDDREELLAIARIKAQKARRTEEKTAKSSASGTDETS